jgi:hypothetical protein
LNKPHQADSSCSPTGTGFTNPNGYSFTQFFVACGGVKRLAEPNIPASTCLSAASCAAIEFGKSLCNQKDHAGRLWFWILLPEQKDLGCRAGTRHPKN